jgi:putative hydroxymethylpyrimidine transport system substrate-binding protein
VALAGCGGAARERRATLLLDFTPNAAHSGIFSAVARGYDRRAGVRLAVRQPSASTDSVKLLIAGRADAAVLDIHDLAIARERGRDVIGVLPLVERPLAALLAVPAVHSPRQLEGHRVGVTGLPSDDAVLRSIVRGAGGDPGRVSTVTIGFNAVAGLLTRRVAGATGFWNVEGVALRRRSPDYREFRVDSYGAPSYPELVVCVTGPTLRRHPELVGALRRALTGGYEFALTHPRAAVRDLVSRAGLDRAVAADQLAAIRPAMTLDGRFGVLDPARLRAWGAWEARFGVVPRPPDVARAFDLAGARQPVGP